MSQKDTIIKKLFEVPIRLEPKEHIYYYAQEDIFTSVSKILASLQKTFDEKLMAERCSKNPEHEHYRKTPQEIIKIWRDKSINACNFGTELHNYAESKILDTPIPYHKNKITESFDSFYDEILSQINHVVLEQSVCFPKYKIAGTFDYLGLFKNTDLFIFDWKTNANFIVESDYCLLPPFDFLDKSKLTLYSIQTFIYKFILEQYYKLSVRDTRIVWFFDPEKTIISPVQKKYIKKEGYGWAIFQPNFTYNPKLIEDIILFGTRKINAQ